LYIQIEGKSLKDFKDMNIILFGAGSCGLRVIDEFENIGANIMFICDNNKSLEGKSLKDYEIKNPNVLVNYKNIPVIISSTFGNEIKEQLNQMGIFLSFRTKVGVHKASLSKEQFNNEFIESDIANRYLYNSILKDNPFFIGRLGSVEMESLCHYLYFLNRIGGDENNYPANVKMIMNINAGFFPATDKELDKFAELYIEDMKQMDVVWCRFLSKFENKIYSDYLSDTNILEYKHTCLPNLFEFPWTEALYGKKVLVIHPFVDSFKENFIIKDKLYENKRFLPDFDLKTYKPVQSIAGNKTSFDTWFDALESMKSDIEKLEFDVALIGAGAYGLPLGAFIKRLGRKAFHIGGILQLYFGVRGKAWDKYNIHNEYWSRPTNDEIPVGFDKVEAGRYW
jgi:hypothetical protein